jgi:hypothetical protein
LKKISIKYLVAAGLLSTTFSFAEVSVSLGVNMGVDAPRPGIIAGVFEMDRHYDEPVYFYKDRYYYGGDYRDGYYFYNGMRLVGGEFYRKPRFYRHNEPRLIMRNPNNFVVFVEDRYYDRPAYFYNGRYYYGGEFRNGYYFHKGRRLHGGKFFSTPRRVHNKHYVKREDVRVYQNEDRRDRDFRRDDREDRRDRDFRRDNYDGQRDRDYR